MMSMNAQLSPDTLRLALDAVAKRHNIVAGARHAVRRGDTRFDKSEAELTAELDALNWATRELSDAYLAVAS